MLHRSAYLSLLMLWGSFKLALEFFMIILLTEISEAFCHSISHHEVFVYFNQLMYWLVKFVKLLVIKLGCHDSHLGSLSKLIKIFIEHYYTYTF